MYAFPLSSVAEKYPVISARAEGWKMHQLWEQHAGTYRSTLAMKSLHSMKRKLSFRDCSMGSSAEVSCNRFGTFCKIDRGFSTPLKVHLSQSPHASKAFHWVLVGSACFLQQEKLSGLSSFSLSCHFKEQLEQNNDEGNKNFKKERSRTRSANIITRHIKKLNIAQCFENQAPWEAEDVLSPWLDVTC